MPLIHRGVVTRLGKMNKTVTVTVPYKKFMKKHKVEVIRHKRYLVHDNDHLAHLNDMVTIVHTVPKYSPRKAFRLYEIHRQGLDPNNYLEPDPAWKSIAAKRAAEDAQVHHRAATAARAQERSRKMAGSQSFMGDLAGAPKPKPKPRLITGDVGESSSASRALGAQDVDDAEAENIEESDEAYEDEVEGHEEEEVVQGEELDREIEEYERSEAGQRERRDREEEASGTDLGTLAQERQTGEEPDKNGSDEGGQRR